MVLLLGGLLAATAAEPGGARTAGSVYVQLMSGAGSAKVRYRGTFFGHVARGRIVATRNVIVSGWDRSPRRLESGLILYRGRNLGFRTLADTSWRLRIRGHGISASGFVRGFMTLNGVDSGDPGRFRIGENGEIRSWPRVATAYRLGLGC